MDTLNERRFGYAAALEQFHPKDVLSFACEAEANSLSGVMAADHVQPGSGVVLLAVRFCESSKGARTVKGRAVGWAPWLSSLSM